MKSHPLPRYIYLIPDQSDSVPPPIFAPPPACFQCMILSYFDENKFSEDRPLFYIGGLMVPDTKIVEVEDTLAIIVRNFSSFKGAGRTPMYRGRSLEPLKDTIYYTRSHHSRFLQLADLVVFLAQRFETTPERPEKWLDAQGWDAWQSLKKGTNYEIKRWP